MVLRREEERRILRIAPLLRQDVLGSQAVTYHDGLAEALVRPEADMRPLRLPRHGRCVADFVTRLVLGPRPKQVDQACLSSGLC